MVTKCIHNKQKPYCKECGGSQICSHNRRKYYCKECGGNGVCEHNIRKSRCKECNGNELCTHNIYKSRCKKCGGNQICSHNIRKSYCKICGGSDFCEHDIQKSRCKYCHGASICEHNRVISQCKDCGGSQICIHNRQKYMCKECNGKGICIHNKNKKICKECDGSQLCKSECCETTGNKKYDGYCMLCFIHLFPDKPITRNYKTKEKAVIDYIFQEFPKTHYSWISNKRIYDGCSRRRPDLFLDLGYQIIIVEVDENQHILYNHSCENKRIMELSQDVNHRPIIFIRFNPDDYLTKEGNITSCWTYNKLGVSIIKKSKQKEWLNRLEALSNQIKYWCKEENKTDKTLNIITMFYDTISCN